MPEPWISLGKSVWGGQTQPIAYQSAALRKSDSMEEKGNLVSMATKVWKRYLEINVILPCVLHPEPGIKVLWLQCPEPVHSPGEEGSPCCSKQLHLLWNNSGTTWRKPHTRQRQAGTWRGRRKLQNNFQTIQSRAVSSSMSVKAQLIPRGEQHRQDHCSWGGESLPWFPVTAPPLLPKSTGALWTSTVKDQEITAQNIFWQLRRSV